MPAIRNIGQMKPRRIASGPCESSHSSLLQPELYDQINAMLQVTPEEYELYHTMPPYRTIDKAGEVLDIPAAYLRDKAARKFVDLHANPSKATHNVIFQSLGLDGNSSKGREFMYAMHDIVLLSQCAFWEVALVESYELHIPGLLPALVLQVPHPEEMELLLQYMHFHNDSKLYDVLLDLRKSEPERILAFAKNIRSLGVLDQALFAVLRTVIEDD